MRKLIQTFLCLGVLVLMLLSARAWVPDGPIGNGGDVWQIQAIAYGVSDPVAPKDYYEEYRFVVPVMYYACDATLLTYYGNSGRTNVDAAFAILNGVMCGQTNSPVFLNSPNSGVYVDSSGVSTGLPFTMRAGNNLDRYSPDLTEFSLEALQINYTAQTLGLSDLKSHVLHTLVGELGLASPDRYVWSMHDRLLNPQGLQNPRCPQDVEYLIVQRNFEVNPNASYPYTPYINDTLYTFYIYENCGNRNGLLYDARTVPTPADPFGNVYTSVASGGLLSSELGSGSFYAGLTRDDVAGLRYLLSSNNINYEATAPSGVTLIETNIGASTPLVTSNLGALIAASKTNDPVTLAGLYPGLVAYGLATNYGLGFTTNLTGYYTNFIGSPYGSPPVLVVQSNLTPVWVTNYITVFGNVVTNHYYPNTYTKVQTVAVTNGAVGSPYSGVLVTNYYYQTVVLTNVPSGDFFLLTGGAGGTNGSVAGYITNATLYVNQVITSNVLVSATNVIAGATNSTSTNAYSYTQTILTYSTNYWMLVQPVNVSSATPSPALRRGIGKMQFIRKEYDSLLGQYWQPITNIYSMVMITNSQQKVEWYQRVVTTPDFLFQVQDYTTPAPPNYPYGYGGFITNPSFDTSTVLPVAGHTGWAGPGTIVIPGGGLAISFNKSYGSLYQNGSLSTLGLSTNQFLNASTQAPFGGYGAFDATTNYPVLYPNTASFSNLLNQVLIQVTPGAVPDGTNGVAYSVRFTAQGGQPPYTWAAPNLAIELPGFSFNSTTATLSGVPIVAGAFNFTLQLTDSANRIVNVGYPITIH